MNRQFQIPQTTPQKLQFKLWVCGFCLHSQETLSQRPPLSKILILTPSPCSDRAMSELVAYYQKMSSAFISLDIQHFGAEKISKPNEALIEKALKKEAEKIDKVIKPSDGVVLMSEHAKSFSTLNLQTQFEHWLEKFSRVCFVFGSAYGLHSSLYQPQRLKLSLSPLTMQHELALVVWMEQLYRLMTLKTGKRYHY